MPVNWENWNKVLYIYARQHLYCDITGVSFESQSTFVSWTNI